MGPVVCHSNWFARTLLVPAINAVRREQDHRSRRVRQRDPRCFRRAAFLRKRSRTGASSEIPWRSPVEPNGAPGAVPLQSLRHPKLTSQPADKYLCGCDPAAPSRRLFAQCLPEAAATPNCKVSAAGQQRTMPEEANRTRGGAVFSKPAAT
jgi:hypothetical protein